MIASAASRQQLPRASGSARRFGGHSTGGGVILVAVEELSGAAALMCPRRWWPSINIRTQHLPVFRRKRKLPVFKDANL
jgi:hypothetical protein